MKKIIAKEVNPAGDELRQYLKEVLSMTREYEYEFEVWQNPKGQKVVVAYYERNGESFAMWTSDIDTISPDLDVNDYEWEVENMTFLRKNGFKPVTKSENPKGGF